MKNFWWISLCALLIIASVIGWSISIRIAVGANAIVIAMDIVKTIWRWKKYGYEKKN